jgi:hypothetical protein
VAAAVHVTQIGDAALAAPPSIRGFARARQIRGEIRDRVPLPLSWEDADPFFLDLSTSRPASAQVRANTEERDWMSGKKQQTFAKLTRERKVKEKRERKAEKKAERARLAEMGPDVPADGDGVSEATSEGDVDDAAVNS